MRKNIFKKLVATVVATAMAVGSIVFPNTNAVAADSVYVIGVNGTWTFDKTLTSTDGVTYAGDIDFTTGGDISIMTDNSWDNPGEITSLNGDSSKVYTKDSSRDAFWFLADGYEAGTYTVTWNKETGALTTELKSASTTTWTYEYYVAGEASLEAELWGNNDAASYGTNGKMTANGTIWTYTAATSSSFDGSAGYNIIKIGVPDDDSGRTIEWLKNGTSAFACAYSGAGTLTITFDEEAGTSEASFEKAVVATIGAQANTAGDKLAFVTTVDIDAFAKVEEVGVLLTKGEVSELTMDDVDDANVFKCPTSYVTTDTDAGADEDDYAFRTIIKNPVADDTYTAVSYVVIDGEVVYGAARSTSLANVSQ